MKKFELIVAAATALSLVAGISYAGANPVKDRQALMKSVGKATKISAQMVKGEVAFDSAKAAQAMMTISEVPDKFVKLLPKGSDFENAIMDFDTESTAAPKIWQELEKFKAGMGNLKADGIKGVDAAKSGEGAFKAAFLNLVKNCKSCHEAYRVKKEQ